MRQIATMEDSLKLGVLAYREDDPDNYTLLGIRLTRNETEVWGLWAKWTLDLSVLGHTLCLVRAANEDEELPDRPTLYGFTLLRDGFLTFKGEEAP